METNEIFDDVCFKLTVAIFYLLMVSFIVPLPGDRGAWMNHYWPAKETLTGVKATSTDKKKPKTPTETIDEKEIIVKAIKKVYNRDFDKKLVTHVFKESEKRGLQADLVIGLIAAESSFRPNVKSRVGAVGYTQVWPKWHQDKINGRNILDPYVNIEVGTTYLKECLARNDGDLYRGLSCYNGSNNKDSADRYYQRVTDRMHELSLAALEVAGI